MHFHAELANSLCRILPETMVITSLGVPPTYYSSEILKLDVNMGRGAMGTLVNVANPFSWRRLYKLLKECQADVFHIVASHEWNPLLLCFIMMMKKPLVFTVHDPVHHLGAPFYIRMSDKILIKNSDAMIVLSQLGKAQLKSKGVLQEKIFHIPLGVYSFFLQWRSKNVQQEKVILFFGRIEKYKGLDFLIKAFSRASVDLPGWKLVIAGSGDLTPFEPDLQHPQIEVINRFISDEEVAALMERSSMVVLPYSEATQSGVIPIAYAFSKPVIAMNVGSLGEMVLHGETGLLVPPNNLDELVRAIKFLANNDLLSRQMGRYAFEWSNKEWGWEGIAQKHIGIYSKVVERSI